jgi:Holliday junction resolvase RusA-like endonuclease
MSSGAVPKSSCLDSGALEGRTGGLKADCPHSEPATGFTLHLPLPPSVNALKRTKTGRPLGNRSPVVKAWERQADMSCMMQRTPKTVMGDFEIAIAWERRMYRKSDIDNRIKILLDWLQSRVLIENDRFCWKLTAGWGTAPRGCVVTVRSVFL